MDLNNLGRLVLFLLPGFVAAEIKNFLAPTRRRSDFERAAESLLISGAAYLIAFLSATLVFRLSARLAGNEVAPAVQDQEVLFILLVWSVAILIGLEWRRVLRSRLFAWAVASFGLSYVEAPSFWAELLQFPSQGIHQGGWVRVYLEGGVKYIGTVTRYTTDPNEPERELILEQIYSVGENGLPIGEKPLPIKLYIPASRIVSLHVLPSPEEGGHAQGTAPGHRRGDEGSGTARHS